MWRVDILPPLYLYKSSGKVVLERSEVGKSCLRHLHCLIRNLTLVLQEIPSLRVIVVFLFGAPFTESLWPKRQEAAIVRFKDQIPSEAIRGFTVMSVEVSCAGYYQGRHMWEAD